MSQLEVLRDQFHSLIDQVDDKTVLARHFGAISSEIKGESPDFWNDISLEEQAEILEAYEESKDETKLIPNDIVK